MRKLLLLLAIIFVGGISFAQSKIIKDRSGIALVCDSFMKSFASRNFNGAFQNFKEYSVIEPEKLDTLAFTAEAQMSAIAQTYGKILTYDFIAEKAVKDILVRRIYVLKFERYMIVFNFTFYYNGKEWKNTSFNYTPDFDDLFK